MGDWESWNNEPSHHKAPENVAKKYAAHDNRYDTLWLTAKIAVILAGAGMLVWYFSRGR